MKSYDGETVLRNLLYDVDRMIRERKKPNEILNLIEDKIKWLKNPGWANVHWWNEPRRKRLIEETSSSLIEVQSEEDTFE